MANGGFLTQQQQRVVSQLLPLVVYSLAQHELLAIMLGLRRSMLLLLLENALPGWLHMLVLPPVYTPDSHPFAIIEFKANQVRDACNCCRRVLGAR